MRKAKLLRGKRKVKAAKEEAPAINSEAFPTFGSLGLPAEYSHEDPADAPQNPHSCQHVEVA